MSAKAASRWALDPAITFLNHGSFGATPTRVLDVQQAWQRKMEREPITFLIRDLEREWDAARESLATLVGADARDLVFVRNATEGVNAVLRSLVFHEGDELLTTNHAYNACKNALDYVAERSGARAVVADVPFPIESEEQALDAIVGAVTSRTKLALIDHITSPTGLIFPIERIVRALEARGVDTLVDGAHGPGMVPLSLSSIGAAYYTGNCHKWLCAPKGAALLHVRRDRQSLIRPLTISHGANAKRCDRPKLWLEFDWQGTFDPSAVLAIPEAIAFLTELGDGSIDAVMRANRALCLEARALLCEALSLRAPAPASMIGSLATVVLPDGEGGEGPLDPLADLLYERHSIEVPVFPFPRSPSRCLRVAAQQYNDMTQYERLARVLADELHHSSSKP